MNSTLSAKQCLIMILATNLLIGLGLFAWIHNQEWYYYLMLSQKQKALYNEQWLIEQRFDEAWAEELKKDPKLTCDDYAEPIAHDDWMAHHVSNIIMAKYYAKGVHTWEYARKKLKEEYPYSDQECLKHLSNLNPSSL